MHMNSLHPITAWQQFSYIHLFPKYFWCIRNKRYIDREKKTPSSRLHPIVYYPAYLVGPKMDVQGLDPDSE